MSYFDLNNDVKSIIVKHLSNDMNFNTIRICMYECMYHTYVCMYVFFINISSIPLQMIPMAEINMALKAEQLFKKIGNIF